MPHEDLEIRITRTGQILVRTDQTGEMEINDLRRFLEESVGVIHAEGMSLAADDDEEAMAKLRAERSQKAEGGLEQQGDRSGEITGTIS